MRNDWPRLRLLWEWQLAKARRLGRRLDAAIAELSR